MHDIQFIPISALHGDNVVTRSLAMPWYQGPSLLYHLEHVYIGSDRNLIDARFPVQWVIRPQTDEHHDYRGYAGQIAAGVFRKGDEVMVLPSGKRTRIKRIETQDGELEAAAPPMAVSILLEDDIDISRGDMICRPHNQPTVAQELDAMVCWMTDAPLKKGGRYLLKHTTRTVKAMVDDLRYRIDVNSLHRDQESSELGLNEIGRVRLRTERPLAPGPIRPVAHDRWLHPHRRDHVRHGRRRHGPAGRARAAAADGRDVGRRRRGRAGRVESALMATRGTFDTGPQACPFIALELDRDRRSERPDYRHRCYAEQVPAPRTIAHQERYCLSPNFSGCPIFQDWAVRAAARPVPLPPGYEGRRAAPAPTGPAALSTSVPLAATGDEPWPDSMDVAPAAPTADLPDEPAEAQQLAAFDGPAPVLPAAGSTEATDADAAPPPGTGVEFAALTAPDLAPEADQSIAAGPATNLERVDGVVPDAAPPGAVTVEPVQRRDTPLESDLLDAPNDAPVPAFLTGRSSRPRSSGPVTAAVSRDDVVPSWETTDRYGAQQDREPRSSGTIGRILTLVAVVIILGLGVLTVLLVPGLLGGSPGNPINTFRPTLAAAPSGTPAQTSVAVVTTPTVLSASPSPAATPTAAATPQPSPRLYKIKTGDTMARISRKFDVSVEEILAANPQITNPDRIQVGQFIVIPMSAAATPAP